MSQDSRQIAQLRFSIRTFRQYATKVLDEMESQIDAMAGEVPEENTDWQADFNRLCADLKKKK